MSRYIDADTFKRSIENAMEKMHLIAGVKAVDVGAVIKAIDLMPTADVVEVVRCGQCKHWKINPHNLYGGYCRYCEGAKVDHYCSYGERKENGT